MWSPAQARAVGQRVALARKGAGLTQTALVRGLQRAGHPTSQASLSYLERGMAAEAVYSSVGLLTAIAHVTGADPAWLISGVGHQGSDALVAATHAGA